VIRKRFHYVLASLVRTLVSYPWRSHAGERLVRHDPCEHVSRPCIHDAPTEPRGT
jgi:hypothetical protein